MVPGTLVFPSSATRMSGNFWGSIKGAKYHFELYDAGDLRELARVPLRGEGSCGGGGAPRDSAPLMLPQKFPDIRVALEGNTKVPGITSSVPLLPS